MRFNSLEFAFILTEPATESRLTMDHSKSRQRAIGLMLVLASIFVFMATLDIPESRANS
jgi:hypothetical protein